MGLLPATMPELIQYISGKIKFPSRRAETVRPDRFSGNIYRIKTYTLEPDSSLIFTSAAHPNMSICILMIEELILQGNATIKYEYNLIEPLDGDTLLGPGHRLIDGLEYNSGFGSPPPTARPGWSSGEDGANGIDGVQGDDATGFDAPPFVLFIGKVTQINIPHDGHFHVINLDISGPRGGVEVEGSEAGMVGMAQKDRMRLCGGGQYFLDHLFQFAAKLRGMAGMEELAATEGQAELALMADGQRMYG